MRSIAYRKKIKKKLFLFIDTGNYRPVGENVNWHSAKVRFIFATTEKGENYLLDTFDRRIQISVMLPTFEDRPIRERLELIQLFFKMKRMFYKRYYCFKRSLVFNVISSL